MKRIGALATTVFALTLPVGSGHAQDGLPQLRSAPQMPKIVGGVQADRGEFPFIVQITLNGGSWCGGSLVAPRWVLTAAHCLNGRSTDTMNVIAGQYRISVTEASEQRFGIAEAHIHEDYDTGTLDNDIALIRLDAAAFYGHEVYRTFTGQAPTAGTDVLVAGWGRTSEGGVSSDVLLEAEVPLVSNQTCNDAYADAGFGQNAITGNMLCAGPAMGGVDACQGDSGGPLFQQVDGHFRQIGVVSWGDGCARPDVYGVYTRVANYTDWINARIRADEPLVGPVNAGAEDLVIWRPGGANWYAKEPAGSVIYRNHQWGLTHRVDRSLDVPLLGMPGGSGAAESVIWRPSSGNWYAKNRANNVVFRNVQWGAFRDIPLLGNVDAGDTADELVIWRPDGSRWFAKKPDGTVVFRNLQWGAVGDVPLTGDVDGDGEDELVIWRPSNGMWFAKDPDNSVVFRNRQWGVRGDIPFVADVNGDGRDDLVVWRRDGGHWYAKDARTDRVIFRRLQWGVRGDIPAVGDVDGDGDQDLVIWRPDTARWYAKDADGSVLFRQVQWGRPH